jgi:RHS repeat-associated protein
MYIFVLLTNYFRACSVSQVPKIRRRSKFRSERDLSPWMRFVAVFSALLFVTLSSQAQVATGTYANGTFDNNGFDSINVGNLNVHFSVPVLNKAGRGLPLSYSLVYDSSIYYPVTTATSLAWNLVADAGWAGDSQKIGGYVTHSTSTFDSTIGLPPHQYTCDATTYNNWVWVDPTRISHSFSAATTHETGSRCDGSVPTASEMASDGSGYTLSLTNYTTAIITSPTGAVISPSTSKLGAATQYDANGNYISTDANGHITDTTGNVALTIAGTAPSPRTYTYVDTTGTSQFVTVTYVTYSVATNFGCSGITEYGPTSTSLIDKITYPDGSFYQFTYEATPGMSGKVTGRLASATLPQGGVITYSYSGGSNGIVCADGSAAGLRRSIASDAGSAASSRTYTRTSGTGTTHTEVIDGLTNYLEYDFVEASDQPSIPAAQYYETSRRLYNGPSSGTAVVARSTCYDAATSPCTTASFVLPISQIDTYETLDGVQMHGATVKLNPNGLLSEQDVYDFGGATARGSRLETETLTYGASVGFPTEVDIYDGSGNLSGKTKYVYDGTAATVSSGVPQHIAAAETGGNLTTMTQYIDASHTIVSTATYEDTGSILTSATPNGTTHYTNDSTFTYATGLTPPTPSSGVSLASSATFDTTYTGLPLTSTDANGAKTQITTANYDSLLRPLEVDSLDSTSTLVGKTTMSYSPYATGSPVQVGQHTYQSASMSSDQETQYDGYGRQSRVEVQNATGWYQTDICYDANGNVSYSSYPYQGAGFSSTSKSCSANPGNAYTNYDVLGRVHSLSEGGVESVGYTYTGRATRIMDTNSVTRISQVDGLGRTAVVCEVTSATPSYPSGAASPASCGTDISGTGFATTYAYMLATPTTTITQGAQTRTFVTDWLGRPTSVTEPESGVTTYGYAYNSTGLVVTRTRPTANQTNASVTTPTPTQYDSMGRPVSVTYSDGTPTKTYAYDAAVSGTGWTGTTQNYLKGRLSLASTSNTGTAYNYYPTGAVQTLYECLPSQCGTVAANKQLSYAYDWAGNLTGSSDGAGVSTTYTPSIANEMTSITSSVGNTTNPANLISGVANGPNGPVSYSLGNGLSTVYGYDTLGRVNAGSVCTGSSPSLGCGGTQMYGFTSNWSGSQVTSSSDSVGQSLGYIYDNFNRLSSQMVSGSTTGLSFGYDRYGNRWNQSTLPAPGTGLSLSYDSNNKLTGGYATYDAAGNMTTDNYGNEYTYDAEGNVLTSVVSSASYVYDALNHRVRTTIGSTATEYVFNANGQRVSIWSGSSPYGQIQGQYYWGGTPVAYYLASDSSTHFQHQDWLGTERLRTTYNGSVDGTFTSLAFGDAQTTASGSDSDAYHYAMLDTDADLTDHAQFRQYSSTLGHWMNPDPYSGSYDMSNPQSMNRYAYVENGPVVAVDPGGLVMAVIGRRAPLPNLQYIGGGFQSGIFGGGGDVSDFGDGSFQTVPGPYGDGTQLVWVPSSIDIFSVMPVMLIAQNNPPAAPSNSQQKNQPLLPNCWAVGAKAVWNAFTGTVSPLPSVSTGIGAFAGGSDLVANGAKAFSWKASGAGFLLGLDYNLVSQWNAELNTPCQ